MVAVRTLVGTVVGVALLTLAAPAAAQPTVDGTVTGEPVRGRTITFRVTSTHPDGWQSLKALLVILTLRGATLEELSYGVDTTTVRAGVSSALAGTGDQVTGRFFSVDALDVRVSTGGDRLQITLGAKLLDDVPEGARFRFVAQDDLGEQASVGRVAATPQDQGGFPWGTLAAAIAVATLAGGFIGSRVTAHRRPRTTSIYQDVARRIVEDRARRGEPPPS
jgi:hypothetical protein